MVNLVSSAKQLVSPSHLVSNFQILQSVVSDYLVEVKYDIHIWMWTCDQYVHRTEMLTFRCDI